MYKHKIVQALANLIETYGGKGSNPMVSILWASMKHEVPHILKSLDDNPEAIAEIKRKLEDVLADMKGDETSPQPQDVPVKAIEVAEALPAVPIEIEIVPELLGEVSKMKRQRVNLRGFSAKVKHEVPVEVVEEEQLEVADVALLEENNNENLQH